MAKIYTSADMLVGNTPLLMLRKLQGALGLKANILAKLEFFNPAGSVKDRVAKAMLDDAEERKLLKKGGCVIEPTSGNTGIGLAALASARGYRVIIVMPDSMSPERIKIMRAYGAEVVLTEGRRGMGGAIERAEEIHAQTAGSIIAGQFENPANPRVHYLTTGREIYNDAEGAIDFFVAGVGTGGTVSGVGRYLKEKIPQIKIIGVEPSRSPVLSGGKAGAHGLQGIGAGFVPRNLERSVLDGITTVTEEQAYSACRLLGKTEGVLAGISSGAALSAAIALAELAENAGKNIAVLFPDGGDRYLSTDLFG